MCLEFFTMIGKIWNFVERLYNVPTNEVSTFYSYYNKFCLDFTSQFLDFHSEKIVKSKQNLL